MNPIVNTLSRRAVLKGSGVGFGASGLFFSAAQVASPAKAR